MGFQRDNTSPTQTMAAAFPTTHWSLVLAAGEGGSAEAAQALARLCDSYWYPVYAYVRRDGHDLHSAQDLTQEFFFRLIEKDFVAGAVQEKGRFRSFLLIAVKRFLVNEWQRTQAQKRGGGQVSLPLDFIRAEECYQLELVDNLTADRIYERRWTLTLLDAVMETLRDEYVAEAKGELFEQLKIFLYGEKSASSQVEIGVRHGLSESAIKSTVHRLRRRYRELLHDEVAKTVASRLDVDDELRHLLNVLSG